MKQRYDIAWLIERYEHNDPLKFIYFWGHTRKQQETVGNFCFSQWFYSPFIVNGITYPTSEHWMMARKALLFEDRSIFEKIIHARTPGEAKELGRRIIRYDDATWNRHKFSIVTLGNIHKFNQHPVHAEYLLTTNPRILVEASPVDSIWGIGMAKDHAQIKNIYAWPGQNLLGFALMEVRDFLQEFGHFEPLPHALPAPWLVHPGVSEPDVFWQTGKGQLLIKEFAAFWETLQPREKTIYELTHPAPYDWPLFYE